MAMKKNKKPIQTQIPEYKISLQDFVLNKRITGHMVKTLKRYCARTGISSMTKANWIKFYNEFMSVPPAILDIRDSLKRKQEIARFMSKQKNL